MKLKTGLLVAALVVAGSTGSLMAHEVDNEGRPPGPGGQGVDGQRPPPPPLIGALDANRDGVIDSTEIDNAASALRKLDKDGDGKLSREELRPPGGPGRFGGPGMQRRRGPGPGAGPGPGNEGQPQD